MMADNMESLAGGTAESWPTTCRQRRATWRCRARLTDSPRLPLLVLTSDDGLAPHADSLVAKSVRAGGTRG